MDEPHQRAVGSSYRIRDGRGCASLRRVLILHSGSATRSAGTVYPTVGASRGHNATLHECYSLQPEHWATAGGPPATDAPSARSLCVCSCVSAERTKLARKASHSFAYGASGEATKGAGVI